MARIAIACVRLEGREGLSLTMVGMEDTFADSTCITTAKDIFVTDIPVQKILVVYVIPRSFGVCQSMEITTERMEPKSHPEAAKNTHDFSCGHATFEALTADDT